MRQSLILACSATKRQHPGELPAIARYDGPAWRTLRANMGCEILPPFVLSAKFGLISVYREIPNYDHLMTPARARELIEPTAYRLVMAADRGELGDETFAFGGGVYRDCLDTARVIAEAKLGRKIPIRFSSGGIGDQLGQLKAFLVDAGRVAGDAA